MFSVKDCQNKCFTLYKQAEYDNTSLKQPEGACRQSNYIIFDSKLTESFISRWIPSLALFFYKFSSLISVLI